MTETEGQREREREKKRETERDTHTHTEERERERERERETYTDTHILKTLPSFNWTDLKSGNLRCMANGVTLEWLVIRFPFLKNLDRTHVYCS